MSSPSRGERGQAAVELVALLPLIALAIGIAWQFALAGHAYWAAAGAARAAARAGAVGGDARRAALRWLPDGLARTARVRSLDDGVVEVSVRIPGLRLGRAGARSRFEAQT